MNDLFHEQTSVPVHPAANCFRRMRDDEFTALVEDIKANGLRDPITMGRVAGRDFDELIDGRNRLDACEVAGIEPRFETFEFQNDDEVRAFVKSRGALRRDLTKGEKAAGLALLYPGGQGKHDDEGMTSAETAEVSERRLRQARQVGRHSITLLEAVRDGHETLDNALETVRKERERLQSAETQLAKLVAEAPDLAHRVQEDGLKLSEAYAAFEQRKRDAAAAEQNKRETLLRLTESAYRGMTAWAADDFAADVRNRLPDAEFRKQLIERLRFDPSSKLSDIKHGAQALSAILGQIAKR